MSTESALSNMLDKFIEHCLKDKINIAMWNLDDYGVLNLHRIMYNNEKSVWLWKTNDNNAKIYEEYKISENIKPFLYDYALDWNKLTTNTKPILLTYPSYEFDNKTKELDLNYVPASQVTIFGDVMTRQEIKNINAKLHEDFIHKHREYNVIRKSILENIKDVNLSKYELIINRIELNDNPEPICYFHCVAQEDLDVKNTEISHE